MLRDFSSSQGLPPSKCSTAQLRCRGLHRLNESNLLRAGGKTKWTPGTEGRVNNTVLQFKPTGVLSHSCQTQYTAEQGKGFSTHKVKAFLPTPSHTSSYSRAGQQTIGSISKSGEPPTLTWILKCCLHSTIHAWRLPMRKITRDSTCFRDTC